jgi:hypothetical protein
MSGCRKGFSAAAIAALALLVAAPSAAAIVRYASPTGGTTGTCTSPDPLDPNGPCTLTFAYNVAVTDDEIIVAPGDYDLGSGNFSITKAVSVHGADGQPMPRIISSASNFAVGVSNANASLRRVAIDSTAAFEALSVSSSPAVEQIVAHSSGAFGCFLDSAPTLRDTVCLDTATNGVGLHVDSVVGTFTANLRNVTAVATGPARSGSGRLPRTPTTNRP